MGFLKWLLWTSFSIGLGIFLATYDVGGVTPWQRLQGLWKSPESARQLGRLKGGVEGALGEVRAAARRPDPMPREHHSKSDREQLNKLIAKQNEAR